VFVQKRTMRPQNDSSKKVEANPATIAASNSHENDVEDVLKGPKATTPQIERWLEEKSNMEPWCALRLLPFLSEVAV